MEINKKVLGRVIAIALFVAVMAGTWDAWWHGAVGRDTFWEPPHILLYSSVLLAISLGIYGWRKTKEKIWKRLAFVLVLVPVSAPFDEIWHRMFGVEDISSPLIVWSPPHVTILLAIIVSMILLLPIIRKDEDQNAVRMFGAMTFASILALTLFLLSPFEPIGPWGLLGFWGAGIIAFALIGTLLLAQRLLPGLGISTLTMAFFIVLTAITLGQEMAPDIIISPHDHPPSWLMVFSLLLPAVFLDIGKKLPLWLKGAVSGALWGGLLFGLSSYFFEPVFKYGVTNALIAIFASLVGGAIVGFIINNSKNNFN